MPNRERVEDVMIDMWKPYRALIRKYLPQAEVVPVECFQPVIRLTPGAG